LSGLFLWIVSRWLWNRVGFLIPVSLIRHDIPILTLGLYPSHICCILK
jgi:hypothetical protein